MAVGAARDGSDMIPVDPVVLARTLGPPERLLVAVDHDGTLSPIVTDPSSARLADGAAEALARLAARAPVAVLSGRSLDDLTTRLGRLPVTLGADHGGTLVDHDGTARWLVGRTEVRAALDDAVARLDPLLAARPDWRIERKDLSVTVHHRRVSPEERARLLDAVRAVLLAVGDAHGGLALLEGRAVLELRARAADKGRALRELVDAHPGRVPLAIGDDVTDEDMFRVALELGGHAVGVVGSAHPSLAQERLAGPAEVVALLAALADDPRTR